MTGRPTLNEERRTLTVRIPLTLRKRGGRKLVVTPAGAACATPRICVNNTMAKALARGFRWRKLLEAGIHDTVEEIAMAERINPSYVSRILRLTLLAPDIVEAILNGRQPSELAVGKLLDRFSSRWAEQRTKFGFSTQSKMSSRT